MNVQTINLSTALYISRNKTKHKKWKWKWVMVFGSSSKNTPKKQSNLFEINYVGLFEYIPYYENHPRKYTE
jgi:hypothetical protein